VTRDLNLPGSATEDEFHVAVADLLDVMLPDRSPGDPPQVFYTTFPAGYGKLSKAMAGRLKAKGMKAGMPDILVFRRNSHNTTCVIGLELKVGVNSISATQRTTHALLQAVGIKTYVIRCLNDVMEALHDARIPHRRIAVQEHTAAPARAEVINP
jgi:hypothetical protein